jgi:hypothetical protein
MFLPGRGILLYDPVNCDYAVRVQVCSHGFCRRCLAPRKDCYALPETEEDARRRAGAVPVGRRPQTRAETTHCTQQRFLENFARAVTRGGGSISVITTNP